MMSNFIRTDIEIGYRIKCFDLDYEVFRNKFTGFKWGLSPKEYETVFLQLKVLVTEIPATSSLVRITMVLDRMCIRFWVQDNSFKPKNPSETVKVNYIEIKK